MEKDLAWGKNVPEHGLKRKRAERAADESGIRKASFVVLPRFLLNSANGTKRSDQ